MTDEHIGVSAGESTPAHGPGESQHSASQRGTLAASGGDLYADLFDDGKAAAGGTPAADALGSSVPVDAARDGVVVAPRSTDRTASRKDTSGGGPRSIGSMPSGSGVRERKSEIEPPRAPRSLAESGLTLTQLCDLLLKQLYLHGALLGLQLSRNARLPFQVVDQALRFLKEEKCVEVTSGELIGRPSYRFHLTDLGRLRAREAFEHSRYVGPAPVSLADYTEQCRRQTVAGIPCHPDTLSKAFEHLIIRPETLRELGPAVCSGRSIFVYGPPGNGKTVIAKGLGSFLNVYGGEIYVPYAIQTEGHVITVFDPTLHQTTDDAELLAAGWADTLSGTSAPDVELAVPDDLPDMRWRRIRRPVVITGGELTLEMLDLRFDTTSRFYQAPLHIKANGGVFLIDDFGRQIVSPRDLLNRWILPLEERVDYLTLATGKKFAVPFEQLIIFSTNLDPRELVDDAFLRRIRHKIPIGPPDRETYAAIFRLCCRQRKIPFVPDVIDFLFQNYYDRGRTPRASDPRDLLEIVVSICRFTKQRVLLTPQVVSEAAARFFCEV